ncbi:hypothetical protein [Arthrobacter sp. PsM3]|uniref:hypothetical protein n=1 Tax=Arthrobacter sp. PsM3 TaxID=3030531 RepID=UPI00263A7728|nr:hypothetical protein [Arthrobacter sp. PsM3]MDN4644385.1 hypothetical protein [Arthrobacter sp. PsM3]
MEQFLPGLDFSVAHSDIFPGTRRQCSEAAREMDFFQASLVRTLLGIRALPQRLACSMRGRRTTTAPEASRRTFRLKDLVGLGWISLGEPPAMEMALGQVSGPWK